MLLQKQKQSATAFEHITPLGLGPRKALKDIKPTSLFGKKIHGYFMLHVSISYCISDYFDSSNSSLALHF